MAVEKTKDRSMWDGVENLLPGSYDCQSGRGKGARLVCTCSLSTEEAILRVPNAIGNVGGGADESRLHQEVLRFFLVGGEGDGGETDATLTVAWKSALGC